MSSAFTHMDPTFMTYNSGPMWILILIIVFRMVCWCTGWGSDDEEDEGEQLVEGLSNYYDALKDTDRSMLVGHETELVSKYGVKTFADERFAKLKVSSVQD